MLRMWLRARRIYEQLNKFIDANGNVDETEARELLDLLSANKALFINILKNAVRLFSFSSIVDRTT